MTTGPRDVLTRWQIQKAKFETVIQSESARWGNMAKFIPFAKSDASYLSGNPDKGDWDRATAYTLNSWLTNRRSNYLTAMKNAGLYQP